MRLWKKIVGHDPQSSLLIDFRRNLVFIMNSDRLDNLEDPFCVVLIAGSPGFDDGGSWYLGGVLTDDDATKVNLYSHHGELLGNPWGHSVLLTIFFFENEWARPLVQPAGSIYSQDQYLHYQMETAVESRFNICLSQEGKLKKGS